MGRCYIALDADTALNNNLTYPNRVSESLYKKVGPVSVYDGHVEEPCEMSMALGARP